MCNVFTTMHSEPGQKIDDVKIKNNCNGLCDIIVIIILYNLQGLANTLLVLLLLLFCYYFGVL